MSNISPVFPYKHLCFVIANHPFFLPGLIFPYRRLIFLFALTPYCSILFWGQVAWAKVAPRVLKPITGPWMAQMDNIPKRGSIYTSHHKKCSLRKTGIVFLQKTLTSQKVFFTKIIHLTSSIFYTKALNFTSKFLHQETSLLVKHD